MLNDWCWVKVDDSEYKLNDNNGQNVAYLIRNFDDRWVCRFYNDNYNMDFGVVFENMESAELVIWKATIWIYDECNRIANSFHHIRDHLPSLRKHREQAEEEL